MKFAKITALISSAVLLAGGLVVVHNDSKPLAVDADTAITGDLYGAANIKCTHARSEPIGNIAEINVNNGNGDYSGTGIYFRIRNNTGIDTPLTLKINSTNTAIVAPTTNVKQTYYNTSGEEVSGIAPRNWGNYMMLPASFDGFIYMNYSTQMTKISGGENEFDPSHIWRIYVEYDGHYDAYADFVIGDVFTDQKRTLDTSELDSSAFASTFINQVPDYQTISQMPRGEEFIPEGSLAGGYETTASGYRGFMIKTNEANLSDGGVYVRLQNMSTTNGIWLMIHVASDFFVNRSVTSNGKTVTLFDNEGKNPTAKTVNEYGYFEIPASFDGYLNVTAEAMSTDWAAGVNMSNVSAVYFEADTYVLRTGDIFSKTIKAFVGSEHYLSESSTFWETWDGATYTRLDGYKPTPITFFDYTTVTYQGQVSGGATLGATKNPDPSVFSAATIDFGAEVDLSDGEAVAFNVKMIGSQALQIRFTDSSNNVMQLPPKSDAASKPISLISETGGTIISTSLNHTTGDDNTIHILNADGVIVFQKDFLVQLTGTEFYWDKVTKISLIVHSFYDNGIQLSIGDIGTVDQTSLSHSVVWEVGQISTSQFATYYKNSDDGFVTLSRYFEPQPSEWQGDVKFIDRINYDSTDELKRHITYDPGDNCCSYEMTSDGMKVHIGPYEATGHAYGKYMALGMFKANYGLTTDREVAYRTNSSGDIEYALGLSVYVKNLSMKEIGFTLQFDCKYPGFASAQRWCVDPFLSEETPMYYAWDVNTDAEYILSCKDDSVRMPAGFEGYIRIPFESYIVPEWSRQEGFPTATELDVTKIDGDFFLTSDNTKFEDLEYIIRDVGFYFNKTQKGNPFVTMPNTIKANLGLVG